MNPLTHFMVGWVGLERLQPSMRDKTLVALAGVAPDLDGLGIVVDFASRSLGFPETNYYQAFHRMYGHGLPAAVVISAVAAALADRRRPVAIGSFIAVHLHFLCDILGSRGASPDDIWPIWYLAPFTTRVQLEWLGQWELVSWQNTTISVVLMAALLWRAAKSGYSPVGALSARGDAAFVAVLRKRLARFL